MSVIRPINNGVTTVAAAGTVTADIPTSGFSQMAIFGRLGNATTPATAAADVAVTVQAYDDTGTNLIPIALPKRVVSPANTLAANVANSLDEYDLVGVERVRLTLTNNNAGALQGATVIADFKSPAVA